MIELPPSATPSKKDGQRSDRNHMPRSNELSAMKPSINRPLCNTAHRLSRHFHLSSTVFRAPHKGARLLVLDDQNIFAAVVCDGEHTFAQLQRFGVTEKQPELRGAIRRSEIEDYTA